MTTEPLAIIVPARDAGAKVGVLLRDWGEHFRKAGRDVKFHVVDDGSLDDTAAVVERMADKNPAIQLLKHDKPLGVGASFRTALAQVQEPLMAFVTLDYGYKPADLDALLKRLAESIDVFGEQRPVTVVNAFRTGHAVPGFWRFVGKLYRYGMRVVMGFKPEPLAGWLGVRNHFRSWWLWLLMGVPLHDPTSGLKLFRRSNFERFPIQSDGDFALVEVIAKMTFLGQVMAEEVLTARKDPIPATDFKDCSTVLRDAVFLRPAVTAAEPAAAGTSACPPA